LLLSDDDDEESESESEEDDDDDDDERDCGSDDRANKNRPSMSVVKLDDKQKKGINPLISGMIARVKTTAIERQRRNGRKGCVGAQFCKIKNVSPKTDRFKVRSLREFGYEKKGR
jgi:hypothetical protein